MWSGSPRKESAQEPAMIEASTTHSDGDVWRLTIRCARRGLTRDREPVIKRKWLIRFRNIDTSMRSCRKHLRRELVRPYVKASEHLS
jgi:hypothetical protein